MTLSDKELAGERLGQKAISRAEGRKGQCAGDSQNRSRELRKACAYVCVRSEVSDLQQPIASVIEHAHGVAQNLLDIVAVEERNPLLLIEPHNNVVWRTGPHGLKLQLTSGITFAAEPVGMKVVARDAPPGSGFIRRLVAEDARQIVRRVLRNLRQARPKLALALMVRQKHVRSRDSLPDRRQRRLAVERSAAAVRFHAEIAP